MVTEPNQVSDTTLSEEIIETLRITVNERYQYKNIKKIAPDDPFFTKERIDELRLFFLNYIYPDRDARRVLNNAFDNLDKHFKNPSHLLDLLGSGFSIAFKLGFSFPKALRAAMHTLDSFKVATQFEEILYTVAKRKGLKPPISVEQFDLLVRSLPKNRVEAFIESSEELFRLLTDIPLLKRGLDVIGELIIKMKKKPDMYDETDIAGITTGYEILNAGYILFRNLSDKEKNFIVDLVIAVESKNLERIYALEN
jgi:hypothetical protein